MNTSVTADGSRADVAAKVSTMEGEVHFERQMDMHRAR
jgi:hypothetical protein